MIKGIVFIIIVFSAMQYSQVKKSGTLLKINIDSTNYSLADTVGYWETFKDVNNDNSTWYEDAIKIGNRSYLLKFKSTYNPAYHFFGSSFCDLNSDDEIAFTGFSAIDFLCAYNCESEIFYKEDGALLIYEPNQLAFLSNDGRQVIKEDDWVDKLLWLIGDFNGKSLAVVSDDQSYNYYNFSVIELGDSTDYSIVDTVYFPENYEPLKIENVNNDLYLCSHNFYDKEIDLLQYDSLSKKFEVVKNVESGVRDWKYENGKFWCIKYEGREIYSKVFNPSDTNFISKTNYYSGGSGISWDLDDFKNIAVLNTDTVKVYNLESGEKKSWDISDLTNPDKVILLDTNLFIQFETKVVDVERIKSPEPETFSLSQNYPNPFNPSTTIEYSIPNVETLHATSVQLKIYNLLGQEVVTLVNEKQPPGNYKVTFDASGLPSGIYFYRLNVGSFSQTRKMVYLR